ncbi:MAG: LemA family protein [Candidatus Uhrbacteria bacterium GW2011_GWA2_52_8d]|uniref:LemA family protein n=1 Tax=Candidatus Uhrbacteria bacterium GW2011_GWA2_52_8d TaxID=1618979 RepID=A0A0G1XQC6_9BACT|nr:MAG: LemA family protein [Candidatus Uhrbacteria bacterium GW2011_GWA2_52_8d]
MELIWILVIIVGAILLWLILTYNGLITSRNRVDESWSDIEVQLKRRYDLIPNIVNTVKGYAKHEDSVFTKVTQARTAAMGAKTMQEHAKTENMLSETLKSLFAVSEAYPALQASTNFLQLQHELTDAEDKIMASRRFYNANVRDFNTKIQVFPTNVIAGTFGFVKREFFDAPDVALETPQVTF